jgi:pyrroline-5-carboxylate reductase
MGEAQLSVVPMVQFLVREQTISIIGAGSLGTAVIDALYSSGHRKIIATRRDEEALKILAQKYSGIETTTDNKLAAEHSDVVVLTVKPKLIGDVAEEIFEYSKDKLVVSLAAGRSLDVLENLFGYSRIARVMTGIFVKDEVAAYTLGKNCVEEDENTVKYIFGSDAREVDENQLAGRTWVACDVGLMAKEIEAKISALVGSGMNAKDATMFYSGVLKALATGTEFGTSCDEIYNSVGGPGSFTNDLYESMVQEGHFDMLVRFVNGTVKKLK